MDLSAGRGGSAGRRLRWCWGNLRIAVGYGLLFGFLGVFDLIGTVILTVCIRHLIAAHGSQGAPGHRLTPAASPRPSTDI